MAVPIVEFGVKEILKCDHSNASAYWAVLSCGTVYYSVHARWFKNFRVWWKLLSSTFLSAIQLLNWRRWFWLFSLCIKSCRVTIQIKAIELYFSARAVPMVVPFEIRNNESYWASWVLSCGTVLIMLYKVALTVKSTVECSRSTDKYSVKFDQTHGSSGHYFFATLFLKVIGCTI